MAKGAIAHNEQFLLSPQCFQHHSILLLVAGQKPATYSFNSFSEMTWEDELLLEKNKFKCLEHITFAFG